MIISISTPQAQFQIFYLGMPFVVEKTHCGFYAVMDKNGESQIDDFEMEGRILDKYFLMERKRTVYCMGSTTITHECQSE